MPCQGLLPPACLGSWTWEREAWRQREVPETGTESGPTGQSGQEVLGGLACSSLCGGHRACGVNPQVSWLEW